jgi:pyochelin biosynthetic protein PchG
VSALRVVVCGTTFGQVYLEALSRPSDHVELAGVLARGSDRSRQCAEHYGVPLYTAVDALPGDIDVACVVIRSGLLGGTGTALAQELMARGIHVLQEHPMHSDELAACLRCARQAGVAYHLNSFYPHVGTVRRFLAAVRELRAEQPIEYVDAACGFQLAYSLLDILGLALGGIRPWTLGGAVPPLGTGRPFAGLDATLAGVPVTLRIQNEMDPSDPDNHAHLDHRITVGTESGSLTLHATHGPLLLTQRPRYPHGPRDASSSPHFEGAAAEPAPSAMVLGDSRAPSFDDIFATTWPPAVEHALEELRAEISGGRRNSRHGQHQLSVCLLWQEISERLGPPALIARPSPRALGADRLESIIAAGDAEPARRPTGSLA